MIIKKGVYMLIMIIVFLFCIIFAAAITGHEKRAYSVLSPDDTVTINQKSLTISELAGDYVPVVRMKSSDYSLPLLGLKYNVVKNADNLDIIYYFVWQDEIHPNPFINKMYKIFRAAYYGYPVRDIEYFQITINPISGNIEKLRFETSPGTDYYVNYSEHLIALYTLEKDNLYSKKLLNKATEKVVSSEEQVPVSFDGRHIQVGVATWNHLSCLISPTDSSFDKKLDADLGFLTDKEYQNGKYARKSQGDHVTNENIIGKLFGGLFSLLFFILSGTFIYKLLFDKKKKGEKNNGRG
jgi:hypothetical protein